MTQDDVIRLARDAGGLANGEGAIFGPDTLIAFAKLVHQRGFMDGYTSCDRDNQGMLSLRIDDVVEEEREALLDLVDAYAKNNTDLAEAIRARGQA